MQQKSRVNFLKTQKAKKSRTKIALPKHSKRTYRDLLPDRSYVPMDVIEQLKEEEWPTVTPNISLGELALIAATAGEGTEAERTKKACLLIWETKAAWQESLKQAREAKADLIKRAEKEESDLKLLKFSSAELERSIPHSELLKKLDLRNLRFRGKDFEGDELWKLFIEEAAIYLNEHLEQRVTEGWHPGLARHVASEFRRWRINVVKENRTKFQKGDKNPRSKKNLKENIDLQKNTQGLCG